MLTFKGAAGLFDSGLAVRVDAVSSTAAGSPEPSLLTANSSGLHFSGILFQYRLPPQLRSDCM
jgi:hypothetical protein